MTEHSTHFKNTRSFFFFDILYRNENGSQYYFCYIIAAPDFAPGKTYAYKYEAAVMGGLPDKGLASAGVKIQSKVLISPVTPETFLLKVKAIHIFWYWLIYLCDENTIFHGALNRVKWWVSCHFSW